MLEDKRLVRELKRGDKQALRRIYEKYKDDLLTIATSLLHDSCAAEDILHDVFVAFAASVRRLQLRSSLKNYLIISVVNLVRDRFRKKKLPVIQLEQIGQISTGSDGPEQLVMFSEQLQLLTAALAKLPLEQREVIILHLNGGMKFKEIADLQGTSISTVQGRYRYGLSKLRIILNGEMKK